MKLKLNPILEKLSGKLKNLVFVSKKIVTKDKSINAEGYIRSAPKKRISTSIRQDNMNIALKILIQNYHDLKQNPSAYQSWIHQAKLLETQLNRTLTPYILFTTYYLTMYTHTLGNDVLPENLSDGTSLHYNHRQTRSWINKPKGFGTGSFGTNTYGT